jgi:hypothetical protein
VYITIRSIVKIHLDCKVVKGGIDLYLNRNLEFQTFIDNRYDMRCYLVNLTYSGMLRYFKVLYTNHSLALAQNYGDIKTI